MSRILLVDDQDLIRAGLRGILASRSDLVVVGEAADGIQAVRLAVELTPDVVLMDLRMPGIDGVEATRRIRGRKELAEVRILVLTTFESDEHVLAALRAGANGFLGKGVGAAELIAAIDEVSSGGAHLSSTATQALITSVSRPVDRLPQDPDVQQRLAALTSREREIVAAVGRGNSNEEVAEALRISPFTVKTHVTRAMAKVGARDRSQLVAFAYQSRLVEPA